MKYDLKSISVIPDLSLTEESMSDALVTSPYISGDGQMLKKKKITQISKR